MSESKSQGHNTMHTSSTDKVQACQKRNGNKRFPKGIVLIEHSKHLEFS